MLELGAGVGINSVVVCGKGFEVHPQPPSSFVSTGVIHLDLVVDD